MNKDPAKAFSEMRDRYNNNPKRYTYNAIIYGDMGTGKTRLLKTAKLPVLVHSFDPGGTITLMDEIKAGRVLADTRFEDEDSNNPTAFEMWEKEFEQLRSDGVFEHIGTYAIDSATTWAEALMNYVLKQAGLAGQTPRLKDWMIQMNGIRDAMKVFTSLPCDCILTGHIDTDKDEVTGTMRTGIMITGKMKDKLPLLFDEIYVSTAKATSKGTEYSLLTRNNGLYKARTRIGRDGKFDMYEKPDIKYLLRKAGFPTDDKELFFDLEKNKEAS